jgi:hypothetical protein
MKGAGSSEWGGGVRDDYGEEKITFRVIDDTQREDGGIPSEGTDGLIEKSSATACGIVGLQI